LSKIERLSLIFEGGVLRVYFVGLDEARKRLMPLMLLV
jgi:hypothetical protein